MMYGKESVSLYRDDGSACFQNVTGPRVGKVRKDVIKTFKREFDLIVTTGTNLRFFRCNLIPFNRKISAL